MTRRYPSLRDRLDAHDPGNWRRYRGPIIALCLASIADMGSTIYLMRSHGVDLEIHPVIRTVALWTGPIAGPVIGKLGQLAAIFLVTLYTPRFAAIIFVAATVLYSMAAAVNLWSTGVLAMSGELNVPASLGGPGV